MTALLVARGAQADGANGASLHVIAVFFMGLYIFAKLKPYMFVIGHMLPGHDVSWGESGDTAINGKCAEPKRSVGDEAADHEAWKA